MSFVKQWIRYDLLIFETIHWNVDFVVKLIIRPKAFFVPANKFDDIKFF